MKIEIEIEIQILEFSFLLIHLDITCLTGKGYYVEVAHKSKYRTLNCILTDKKYPGSGLPTQNTQSMLHLLQILIFACLHVKGNISEEGCQQQFKQSSKHFSTPTFPGLVCQRKCLKIQPNRQNPVQGENTGLFVKIRGIFFFYHSLNLKLCTL